MNKLSLCIIAAISLLLSVDISAQENPNTWSERMKSEKIGFLTSFMDLSQEEAEIFWPVYNKAEKESSAAMEANFHAYRALQKAIKERQDENEVEKLLHEYLKAAEKAESVQIKYAKEYEKILPPMKVAKLYVAEEEFRRQQIIKLPHQQFQRFR